MADPDAIYELTQRIESNLEIDKRVAALHSLHTALETAGYVVEADAVTSAVKVALKHSNQSLSTASLTFIPTYASMIYTGDGSESHHALNHNVRNLINSITLLVNEKLGDQKERIREAARTALIELGNAAYSISSGNTMTSSKGKETETPLGIFERAIREGGLTAKMARVREQSVLLLPILRENCERYPVKPLLGVVVELLSDADATVREGARSTVVALFSGATGAAKADLKKEMERKQVRKQTMDGILREVLGAPSAAASSVLSPTAPTARSHNADSDYSKPAPTPSASQVPTAGLSAAVTATADDIKPVYIASRSDLERTFTAMLPFFEGKESEHNWLNREQSMIKIRGLIVSPAHRQFTESFFVSQLKLAQEGILKCVASLRTTLSMHAIHLVQELAIELGDDLAPCIEPFLTHLTAMAGFTKKLVANATQEAAAAIMVSTTFRPLYLQLIWQGAQEKNVATRTAAAEHLCTVLRCHAPNRRHAVESHGGLDLLDKCLRKGVGDSNPAARTKSREAFWIFHKYWPDQANAILNSLDPSTRKQVAASAPADVPEEVVVEAKPKSTVGPVRARPGGASMALIQAKKAAAAKANMERMERERRAAEEAALAHEARVEVARRELAQQHLPEMEEHATPVAASKKSTGFMPIRKQPASLKPSNELSVLVSPGAHQRIETAVKVPLPSSPTDTPQARRIESDRDRLSPVVMRNRVPSTTSSSSSQGSYQASAPRTKLNTHHFAPALRGVDADLADLSVASIASDGDGDATQIPLPHPTHGHGGEDDTVQLSAPEDASMDLMGAMNFSSPFKLPPSATAKPLPAASNGGDTTPQAKAPQRTVSTSSSSSGGTSSTTPGSAVRRSGLPRPVSMMPSPSPSSSAPTSSLPRSVSNRTLPQGQRINGGGSVLENRAARLESSSAASPSPAKAKPEVGGWIAALQDGTADVKVFRRLARLSAEFRVEEEGGDETVLTPGPGSHSFRHAREEGNGETLKSGIAGWLEGGLFERLFDSLKPLLSQTGEVQLSAQVVLHRLVENQFPLFSATNRERDLLELLLSPLSSPPPTPATSSAVVARKAALQGFESLLFSWSSRCDPVLGLNTLLYTLPSSPSASILKSGLSPILLKLPPELLLEDFLPRLKPLIVASLTNDAADIRLGAVTMLKKVNDKVRAEKGEGSHERIFGALGLKGEEYRAQLDLLMYYFEKK